MMSDPAYSSFIIHHSSFGIMCSAPRFSAPMRPIALLAVLALAFPASASIAVFTDGRSMKVASFKAVDEETMKLTMTNGGAIQIPLARIDRIIDDEITTPEVVAEVKKIVEEGVFPHRSWRFNESSGPIFKSKYDAVIVEASRKFDVDA